MAADLRFIDLRRYEYTARAINDVGRLVGGWLKAHRSRSRLMRFTRVGTFLCPRGNPDANGIRDRVGKRRNRLPTLDNRLCPRGFDISELTTMSRYRRATAAGSSYFFTVVAYWRQPVLCGEAIRNALCTAIETVRRSRPFVIDAPD